MRLPSPEPRTESETVQQYGLRILGFVLRTNVTATLTDLELELADHVYPLAIQNPDLMLITREYMTAARHRIMAALKYRQTIAPPPPDAEPAAVILDRPNAGPMAPLRPTPTPQPPPRMAADLAF